MNKNCPFTLPGFLFLLVATSPLCIAAQDPLGDSDRADEVINLWPQQMPGAKREIGAEDDTTQPDSDLVAGKRVIRLGNVSTPQIHVFHAPEKTRNGTAIVICPGGGFHILAWDLEGTEIAKWLNSIGTTAVVLKYRVPTAKIEPRWLQPVQDAQRAISLTRSTANAWNLNSDQIGILGFSAGGKAAAVASYTQDRHYPSKDEIDKQSCKPNFSILIYGAGLVDAEGSLHAENQVSEHSPPTFVVHAFDDFVPIQNCLSLMSGLKKANVPSELHIFDSGGHGYGLRIDEAKPVTGWPKLCETWLARNRMDAKQHE